MTDWAAFRSHFPVTTGWAFLDHAAVAPLPTPAVAAMTEYSASLAANGVAAVGDWFRRLQRVRQSAAALVNAPAAEDICFVPSTTYGIGLVAEGFPWRPGDNVVLPAEEYPSNQYAWQNQRDRGVEVRAVPSRGSRVETSDLLAAVDGRTRVLAVSAVQFGSGFRADLAALGDECRRRGLFFFVDAIQHLGAFPLDVQALGIDALAADGHKWLLGPEGAGVAYVRREWAERLRPCMVGWNSMTDPLDFDTVRYRPKPHAGRWEGGTLNVPGLAAMGASIDLLLGVGVENVARRVVELTDHLCDRAASAGLEVFSSRAEADKSGIVSLVCPGREPAEVMRRCRDGGVIVNVRHGRLRVSPHAYNTPDEIDRFLSVVR